MSENIFNNIEIPPTWYLDTSSLVKGIDNYHVDVRLSKRFCSDLKVLITELIRRETDQKKFQGDENAEPYYEVVTNGKVIGMLRDKLNSQ